MIIQLLGGIRATIFAATAALLLMVAAVQHVEVRHYKAHAVTLQSAIETIKSQDAAQLAEQKLLADAKEKAQAAATAAAERQMMQDNADAEQKYKDTIAGLRAGTVRLRHEWTCPSVPQVGASTGKPDGSAEQREQDASDLVRLAAEADSKIRALQSILRAERE